MSTTDAAPIELRLLGSVDAIRAGDRLAIGGPRQRALLGLLAIERGRAIAADRLIDELWAGDPPDGAEVTLRTYVSRLRVALGRDTPIRASVKGYALEIDPGLVDATRFERLIRDGEAATMQRDPRRAAERLQEALALWRGRPFGDLADEGALRAEAERLEQLRLHAIELRIDAGLAIGAAGGLVDELETLVRDHPFREAFWRQLMLALYRAERQSDALAAYHTARAALGELGLEPGLELQALQGAILRHEVPLVTLPEERHNLPTSLTSFVGREIELADVAGLLDGARLLTLTGVGGVGKTRLAIEAARTATNHFRDGVHLVDLATLADPALVPTHVGMTLEVAEQAAVPPVERLVTHLRRLEVLLVLDNCEHVRAACARLASRLLEACPDLRILATSRELLGVPGEMDYPVPPLQTSAAVDDPGELRSSEAVRLFLARARAARSNLEDDDATIRTVATICEDLDGLPLGIELAAARARALSPSEIAGRLHDRFQFLVSWRRLTPARHRTLREAMDWSYDLLDAEEQAVLRGLSAFAGGFTLDAVADVCTGGENPRALDSLERLIEASLVNIDVPREPTRYRILETVRQYGAARLDAAGETDATRARHAAYFASLADARVRAVEELGRLTPLADLRVEDANLRAALHYLQSDGGEVDMELRMCASLWRYWWLRGQLAEGREHIRAALDRAGEGISIARVEALRGASSLALRQGDVPAAVELGEQSVAVAKLTGAVPLARAQLGLANALASAGDVAHADELYRASAARFREEGLDWDLGVALLNIADLAFASRDLAAVERAATESLAIFRRTEDDAGIAVDLGNLAFVALERGDLDTADVRFREALERSNVLGFREWISIMLDGLAAVATRRGDISRALRLLAAAGQLRGEIGASLDSIEGRTHDETLTSLRNLLGGEALERALARGAPISAADAVALGLGTAASREGRQGANLPA